MSTTNLGIGSILGSSEKTPASLRRTLSADMSSKKWLTENGFTPLKKIASSQQLQIVSELDIWSSVQADENKKDHEKPQAPYVHPLTKRSRSLSQKSLEICTESLGSETGSDGFSSYSPSEASDGEQDEHEEVVVVVEEEKEMTKFVGFNSKKVSARSFPPPLPSLSLHMRSHRQDGRLVVEAIPTPVPSKNHFHAQRENGRLLLTFIDSPEEEEVQNNMDEQVVAEGYNTLEVEMKKEEIEQGEEFKEDDNFEDDEEDETEIEDDDEDEIEKSEEEEKKVEMEKSFGVKATEPKTRLPTGVINVHRSALMVNKLMGLTNRDPSWSPKLQSKYDITHNEPTTPQSLPPRIARMLPTPATAAASFNTYNYCWRNPTQSPTLLHSPNKVFLSKNINPQEEQRLVLMRGNKAEYLLPLSKGCKEPRRSLLIWEPCCIATS